jgi:uncharacterized protein YbjT (DUF2867 family)
MAKVLVVGATGALGRKVVDALHQRDKKVRALVRPGSDASALEAQGVDIARGDMMDPPSLRAAMSDMDAVITTAAGYTRRRKSDSTEIDVIGNRNLADAARETGVPRFVLTSILACDKAPDVPHFWHKKLAEDFLEERGVPFVALRPGAFLDQSRDFMAEGVAKGRIMAMGAADVSWTWVYTPDLGRALAAAVDAPARQGERIDIGWDRALTTRELAAIISAAVGKPIGVRALPWWLLSGGLKTAGLFSHTIRDVHAMLRFFRTGAYVADTSRQAELLGPVPTAEEAVTRWLQAANLVQAAR